MGKGAQAFGIAGTLLGGGMSSIRAAIKYFNWELPAWIEIVAGFGGLLLFAIGLPFLLEVFLQWLGTPLPSNSPWPGTMVYSIICFALIVAAGYLPTRISPRASSLKTRWEPALTESFFLHIHAFELGKRSSIKVKIVATEQGAEVARL